MKSKLYQANLICFLKSVSFAEYKRDGIEEIRLITYMNPE